MKKSIQQLKEVLRQEIEVYSNILALSIKKTDIVVAGQIKELDEITQEEQNLIIKIGKLDDIRERIILNIKQNFGIDEELNMAQLSSYLKQDDKCFIESQKNELSDIFTQIKDRNTLNATLINDSLEYINLNLELFTSNTLDNTYGNKSQQVKTKSARRMFDTKA